MHLKRSLLILLVLAAAATAAQAEENQDVAKDQDVAKECEAKTLKAHPNKLPNTEATDKLRQEFYTTCINRAGKMNPDEFQSTVTDRLDFLSNNVHESTNRSREIGQLNALTRSVATPGKKAYEAEQTAFPRIDLYKAFRSVLMHHKITITLAALLLLGTSAISFAQGGGGGGGGAGGAGGGAGGASGGGAGTGTGGAAGTPGTGTSGSMNSHPGTSGSMNSNPGTSGSTSDTLNKPSANPGTGGSTR